jgi:hypothetical protein
MSRVKIVGLENIANRTKRLITRAISDSRVKDDIAKSIAAEIRENEVIPELRASSIKHREYIAANNFTHPDFSPRTSNLTIIGEFLDSLRAKYITARVQFIFEFPSKRHPGYFSAKGKLIKGDRPTMAEIANHQSDLGRNPFQVLNRADFLDKISGQLATAVRKFLRN